MSRRTQELLDRLERAQRSRERLAAIIESWREENLAMIERIAATLRESDT